MKLVLLPGDGRNNEISLFRWLIIEAVTSDELSLSLRLFNCAFKLAWSSEVDTEGEEMPISNGLLKKHRCVRELYHVERDTQYE